MGVVSLMFSYYKATCGINVNTFPWKIIWCQAPKKVFFLSTAAWGKILINDNLLKGGFFLVGWFCMCQCNGKTVDHLLLHCDIAYVLWSEVFKLFGAQWMMPLVVSDLLFGCRNWFGKHRSTIRIFGILLHYV